MKKTGQSQVKNVRFNKTIRLTIKKNLSENYFLLG